MKVKIEIMLISFVLGCWLLLLFFCSGLRHSEWSVGVKKIKKISTRGINFAEKIISFRWELGKVSKIQQQQQKGLLNMPVANTHFNN